MDRRKGRKVTITEEAREQRRQAPLKHGGEAALKAFQRGEPFTGIAAEVEAQVRLELETVGLIEMTKMAFVRAETMTRLFYNGAQDANERRDFEQTDRCTKRYGWLEGVTGRLRIELAHRLAQAPNVLDYEQMTNGGKE